MPRKLLAFATDETGNIEEMAHRINVDGFFLGADRVTYSQSIDKAEHE